jgi:hypothetical protein
MSTKIKATGSRAEVFHSRARHTSGGLKKSDLMQTKNGRIVSRKAHAAGKKAIKRLRALGYVAKKGTFRLFRKGDAKMSMSRKSRKRSTRRRGGSAGAVSGFTSEKFYSHAATGSNVSS